MKKMPWAELVCFVGVLVFILGGVHFIQAKQSKKSSPKTMTSLTERNIAIEEAKKEGKSTYSYTTHFIPGIGLISNPDAYAQNWQKSIKGKN